MITFSSDGSVSEGNTWNFISDITYSQEGNTEVENMVLNGRAFVEIQDGGWFIASNNMVASGEAGPGAMSSIYAGPNAICTISVSYFDESDGNGWYGFFVNENKLDEKGCCIKKRRSFIVTISICAVASGADKRSRY